MGHHGVLRALASFPAIAGSLGLLLVLGAPAGGWEGLVLVGWIAAGGVLCTRPAEHVAVRLGYGFRSLHEEERALLLPAWAHALAAAQVDDADVDIYVQPSWHLNAFAAGRRSVAVTTGVLDRQRHGRLEPEQLVALLVHELGHHATQSTRWGLSSSFLAAPWRLLYRLGITIATASSRRGLPTSVLVACALGASVTAALQESLHGHWAITAGLASLIACTVGCPLADAAVSRRSELAADAFATRAGLGRHLASALQAIPTSPPKGVLARGLARHPSTDARLRAIAGLSPDSAILTG